MGNKKKRKYEYAESVTLASNKKSKSIHIKLKTQKSQIVHLQKNTSPKQWHQNEKADKNIKESKPMRPPLSNSFVLTQSKLDDHNLQKNERKKEEKLPKLTKQTHKAVRAPMQSQKIEQFEQ